MADGILSLQNKAIATENLLTPFCTFNDSTFAWNTVSGGANAVAENAPDNPMIGTGSCRITFTGTGTYIFDCGGNQMDFIAPKDGKYLLQYWFYKTDASSDITFITRCFINGLSYPSTEFTQNLYSDSGFIDGNWNCYFSGIPLDLLEDDEVTFQFEVHSDTSGSGVKLFLDGLKLELMELNQNYEPSIYSEPTNENPNENLIFVNRKEDFPTAVTGVITLLEGVNYFICTDVDLSGDRIVCSQNTTLIGGSSENCRIKSTGLSSAVALITSAWSLPMNNLTIEHGLALNLDATANANQAIDWNGVNFTSCAVVGTIKNYTNFVMNGSAFLESQGLTFDGTFGTIAFDNCLFNCIASGTSLILPSTLTVTTRFRVIYSSFVIGSGETGINVSTSATIPTSGYILDKVNFSGAGTYTTGVLYTDNKASFSGCKGISNSGNMAQYYMAGNATPTVVAVINTYYKILGTTSSGTYVEKFTLTSNKALYSGVIEGLYKVSAMISLTSGNTNVISARIAKNGVTSAQSTSKTTTSGIGKSENIGCFDLVNLTTNDYVEVFIANDTLNDITVTELTVIIERLN